MAEIDPELRDAILAYFRGAGFARPFPNDEAFIQFADGIIRENRGGLQEAFLAMREQLGRYPTFAEMRPPFSMGIDPSTE